MKGILFVDVDYRQFSEWGYQKPTRVWGDDSIKNVESRVCDVKTCLNVEDRPNGRRGHCKLLGGYNMTTTRNQKYRVPPAFIHHLCGWPSPEGFEAAINLLSSMSLSPLPEVRIGSSMSELDLQQLVHTLDSLGQLPHFVQGVMQANKPYEGGDVDRLRAKILEYYADSVFSNKPNPNPPDRGPFGEATIESKPRVNPFKQRPFRMHGERYEA